MHSSRPASLLPFDFHPLNRVVYGPGTLARLGELVRDLGGSRVMLVTDPGLLASGHPHRASAILRETGLSVFLYDRVKENPSTQHVDDGVAFAREQRIDFLVALGGGSSMDLAKGVNFILTNGGRMIDYKGFGRATLPMLPSIGIPTTAGTGSESQSYALISDASSHMKMACGDRKVAFRVCILDPELSLSAPRSVTAVTGIDALSHAVESYVCTKSTAVSRLYALTAWQYLEPHFATVLTHPNSLEARSAMLLGAHFAGMAIENSMLGITHSCSNPLTAHYGAVHGVAIGILLPTVIRFNAPAAESLYQHLMPSGSYLNGEPASEVLARRMSELVQIAGLPRRLREIEVSETILPLLAEEASQQWTAKFNPRAVTEDDLLEVYRSAW